MSLDKPDGDSISVFQFNEMRRAGTAHVLLDVREDGELAVCRVKDAVHIPMGQVPSRVAELPADTALVVMCHHGMRSMRVVNFLRGSGFDNAVNLDGGIDAWASEIDPAVGRY